MLEKMKYLVPALSITAASAVPVLAEGEGGGTANQAVVTAMQGVAGDMTATGTAILPIALGVVGLAIVVVFGIRIFKKVVNK